MSSPPPPLSPPPLPSLPLRFIHPRELNSSWRLNKRRSPNLMGWFISTGRKKTPITVRELQKSRYRESEGWQDKCQSRWGASVSGVTLTHSPAVRWVINTHPNAHTHTCCQGSASHLVTSSSYGFKGQGWGSGGVPRAQTQMSHPMWNLDCMQTHAKTKLFHVNNPKPTTTFFDSPNKQKLFVCFFTKIAVFSFAAASSTFDITALCLFFLHLNIKRKYFFIHSISKISSTIFVSWRN